MQAPNYTQTKEHTANETLEEQAKEWKYWMEKRTIDLIVFLYHA